MGPLPARLVVALGVLAYVALAAFVLVGFSSERSHVPWVLGYSLRYAVFLVGTSVLLAIPLILLAAVRRFGARVFFALAPALGLAVAAYFAASTYYYWTVTHLFDPYLQMPPARLTYADRRTTACRILTAGGSTTENDTLPPDARYPHKMQEFLDEMQPARRTHVFNGGVSFWTAKHNLINYVTHMRYWNPDVVVFMEAINDLYRSFSPERYAIGQYDPLLSHFYGPSIDGALQPSFPRQIGRKLFSLAEGKWYASRRFLEVDMPIERFVSLPQFEQTLRSLVHYVRSDGAEIVLMTQPSILKPEMTADELAILWFGRVVTYERTSWRTTEHPSPASLGRAHEAFNDATRRVAEDVDVPLVDLARGVPRDLEHFTDDVHYTPKGAALVARLVADRIVKVLSQPRPGGREVCNPPRSASGIEVTPGGLP